MNDHQEDDDDEFWIIAMGDAHQDNFAAGQNRHDDDDDDDSNNNDTLVETMTKRCKYVLPNQKKTVLELESLPEMDGIWSPLGAKAWYSSALLSVLFFSANLTDCFNNGNNKDKDANYLLPLSFLNSTTEKNNNNNRHDNEEKTNNQNDCPMEIAVLELGSGAVGLSGLACAVALKEHLNNNAGDNVVWNNQKKGHHPKSNSNSSPLWKIILTDHEPNVLDQLNKNVVYNLPRIVSHPPVVECHPCSYNDRNDDNDEYHNPTEQEMMIQVHYLDWNDDDDDDNDANVSFLSGISTIHLVIGSELVYSEETALACTKIFLRLLRRYMGIQIWVVQVIDRYGWMEIVLPKLEKEGVVIQQVPIPYKVHEIASTMIPMGGTLDQHAYGAFCISNNNNDNNNNTVTSKK